jgi:hypothetical protein
MNNNLHSQPVWFGFFLWIIGTVLIVLPISTIIEFFEGTEPFGLFGWAVIQLTIAIIAYAWGADVVFYHDRKLTDD